MSDVVVSVIESTTAVTVTEQDVAVAVTETPVTVTTATAGLQGIQGIGYTGVTSTTTITIGSGLKTFTLVSGYQGAFITGMRIRAIHSDTPTYYVEGTANYVGAGTLIITVDKFNGSGSHNLWAFASAGEIGATGATGATGASGVVSVTSPITNTGTAGSAIVGINQTALSLTRSQISDFTSGTVTSASTAQQSGTAVYSVNSGTAVYATTSGTALTISGSITQSQVTNLTSDLALKAPLASPTFSGTVTLPLANTGLVTSSGSGVVGVTSTAPGLGYIPYTGSVTGGYAWLDLGLVARDNIANAFTVGGHSITSEGTAVVPLVIKGASGQSANLQEWQNSGSTAIAKVDKNGAVSATYFGPSGVGLLGYLDWTTSSPLFQTGGTAVIGLRVRGAASQSANLQEWQDSAGTVYTRVASGGQIGTTARITVGQLTISTAGQLSVVGNTDRVQMAVVGNGTQTTNLTEWQNSGGTVLARIDPNANIYTGTMARATSSVNTIHLSNATIPTANPTGGGVLYVESGALKFRGSSGTITTIANA